MEQDVKAHAKFSASGSYRWLACPGSIALSAKAPPQRDSPYAAEGTRAHEVLEAVLSGKGIKLDDSHVYPHDMWKHAQDAADWIKTAQKIFEAELLIEQKVELDFVFPGMFGTVDAAIVCEFGRLVVVDYKYGAGLAVDPELNSQLIYYALGLAHRYHYNFIDVELVIIQPRADHYRGPVRSWIMPIEDLIVWGTKFREGVSAALKPDAPLASGSHCRFCPAAPICPQLSRKAFEQAQIDFDEIITAPVATKDARPARGRTPTPKKTSPKLLPEVKSIAIADLPAILTVASDIERWLEAVRSHALDVLTHGEKIPGWKLVPKRGRRQWNDESKVKLLAEANYGEMAFTKELLSPAQFEKRLSKDFVAEYAVMISSGTTLAPESDKRESIEAFSEFTEV